MARYEDDIFPNFSFRESFIYGHLFTSSLREPIYHDHFLQGLLNAYPGRGCWALVLPSPLVVTFHLSSQVKFGYYPNLLLRLALSLWPNVVLIFFFGTPSPALAGSPILMAS
jgi:hypothetical protein